MAVRIFNDEQIYTTAEFARGELKSAINLSGMGLINERIANNEGFQTHPDRNFIEEVDNSSVYNQQQKLLISSDEAII